ncbi:MAG TPA: gliding motility-associated C-terminal domain-containing protein [Flavobacteriales bacterium]|nr:gliding motility-associated C-terminal domain-containing protein [Flavobacteriales bacterium]
MKNVNFFKTLSLFFFAIVAGNSWSQQAAWKINNQFDQRCFVENLGQFDGILPGNKKVLFGSKTSGTDIYFTENGIVFRQREKVKRSSKEIHEILEKMEAGKEGKKLSRKEERREEEREKEKLEFKFNDHFIELTWKNAEQHIGTLASGQVVTSYHFPEKNTNNTLQARGFKKLVYYNVYPGIDVELFFPVDSSGIKYNYIVKKGASAALIKEEWGSTASLNLNSAGGIAVNGPVGNLVFSKPVSFSLDQSKSPVKTTYSLQGNVVSYTCDVPAEGMIIDPWVDIPPVGSLARCYDVEYDNSGNVFAFGGDDPLVLLKYNSAGVLVWSYTVTEFSNSGISYYGDFAVDRYTGSSYLIDGYGFGGGNTVLKLSNGGVFAAGFAAFSIMDEMWRIIVVPCTNQVVIGGGGAVGNQMAYLDTNLSFFSPVAVFGASSFQDIAILTADKYGNCYYLPHSPSSAANQLHRSPLPAFLPVTYSIPTGFSFNELSSLYYYSPTILNGYNGVAIANTSLYAYDGFTIQKRDAFTGSLLITKNVVTPTSSIKYWGGIAVDECQNLFVGVKDTIYQYDSLLNVIQSYYIGDSVIDVAVTNTGMLYATGYNFVTAFAPSALTPCLSPSDPIIDPNLVVNGLSCSGLGSAWVTPTGGTAPYTVTWNTSPAVVGDSIFNLTPGTYSVTIDDASASCSKVSFFFTIDDDTNGINATIVVESPSCGGYTDGSITVTPTSGIAPFTYSWASLSSTDSIVNGLGAGTYVVTIIDSTGCGSGFPINVTEPVPITAYTNAGTVDCVGGTADVAVLSSGGTGPYTVVWNLPAPVANDTLYNASSGIYSITVTDDNGCILNFTDTLEEPAPLTLSFVTDSVGCLGSPGGSIIATPGGGTGAYTYLWSNNSTLNSPSNTGLAAGVYSLTVTDANGCTISLSDTVYELIFPAISFTNKQPCNGGSNGEITASATGGSAGTAFSYSWNTSPAQSGLTATGLGAGAYILSVTANGCTATFPTNLNENALEDTLKIMGVSCDGAPLVEMYLPGIAGAAYQWYLMGTPIPGETTAVYNASSANAFNLSGTWYYGGCRYITTTVEVGEYPVASKTIIPNVFTPNGDGYNSTYYAMTFIPNTGPDIISYLFSSYHIEIYNRWGQLMFKSDDPNAGWKGDDLGGAEAAAGVYYVLLKYKALCSDVEGDVIYNGTVQLVR